MQFTLRLFSLALLFTALASQTVHAAPDYRGFQIGRFISDAELDQLKNEYEANIVRIQVGDDALMDSVTGQDYIDMMEGLFDALDPLFAKLAARNIKIVFAMYSPPGGFETRSSPSHYRMFSQASLQTEFIDMWLRIMARYKDNANIYAFDLLNEPAMRKSQLGAGAREWNTLLLDTISAIRAVAPNSLLMVKSLYGDPGKLSSLPAINDANIIYSYHPYLFLGYQHSGIDNFPTTVPAPNAPRIKAKLDGLLNKFYLKHYQNFLKKKVPASTPVLNTGEIAVSGAAKDAGLFIARLLAQIEATPTAKQEAAAFKKIKKKNKQKKKLVAADFRNLVKHQSWTIHAFDEAPIWDPRYQCESLNDCEFVGDSERNDAIKQVMTGN